MAERLVSGDRRMAARVITMAENRSEKIGDLMKLIYPHTGKAMVIGLTGAGGSGKSTLIDRLIGRFRQRDMTVGVIAVDPSSPFSGGAILGDRIRFQKHSIDDGVFIRSMGSRGYLGGLARAASDVVRIIEALGQDVIIVETLGAGQDEVDVFHVAQTCLLLLTPGMGDDIQAMKAGIMEIAHLIVLNKADLDGAEACLRSLEATLHMGLGDKQDGWIPRILPTVAAGVREGQVQGIEELFEAILAHQMYLRESRAMDQLQAARVEQELGLIFKDELEKIVFAGLKGTGRKRDYIEAIMAGRNDPYSVVEEVLREFFIGRNSGERSS
ncbi:MAG: methylmalonyl Co-A mutase-associated GTPase MeaB [Proteobacteria bacterium]|nr:methylmalonyl Co-A mutase-associated GTPase MeaB [Pseudomonadota bacterium]